MGCVFLFLVPSGINTFFLLHLKNGDEGIDEEVEEGDDEGLCDDDDNDGDSFDDKHGDNNEDGGGRDEDEDVFDLFSSSLLSTKDTIVVVSIGEIAGKCCFVDKAFSLLVITSSLNVIINLHNCILISS